MNHEMTPDMSDDVTPAHVTPTHGTHADRRTLASVLGVTILIALLVAGAVVVALALRTPGGGGDYEVVIQPGTAALADTGQDVEFFPDGFTMRVGDTLVIRNLDNATAELGPFVVAPGEILTKQFSEPGTIEGYCSYTDAPRTFLTVVP